MSNEARNRDIAALLASGIIRVKKQPLVAKAIESQMPAKQDVSTISQNSKESWASIIENPGMLGVSMQGKRPDCTADRISIRLQPAGGLENGVFVAINQHYDR